MLFACAAYAADQQAALEAAITKMQSGDLAGAERMLKSMPTNADVFAVLGVVLDQEKKYSESETAYRNALRLTPGSVPTLNNYGNHLLATGKVVEAQKQFRRVLALDPQHANAAIQLARIAIQQRSFSEALHLLQSLTGSATQSIDAGVLRMQANYALQRNSEADAILAGLEQQGVNGAVLGQALVSAHQYEKALPYLTRALQGDADNADVLYNAAFAEAALNHNEQALRLLAHVAKVAPSRADVQRLLARTTGQLGFTGDSVAAWKRYRELAPNDDDGRRELGFAETAFGETAKGIADLKWYVERHPNDALGHYELGTALAPEDSTRALPELNRALALQPNLPAAHIARGILYYRQGEFQAALNDFLSASKADPDNAATLDRVGETYLALHQPHEAVPYLSRAVGIAPREPRMQLHLGRALYGDGQNDEANRVMARFRELGADKSTRPRSAGIVDFLNLSPAEQLDRYRQGVEKTVEANPNDAEAQLQHLLLLLERGAWDDADAVASKLVALHASPVLVSEAVKALITAQRFQTAEALIVKTDNAKRLGVDLAIVRLHTEGPAAALAVMNSMQGDRRTGDFYLALAQILVAADRGGRGGHGSHPRTDHGFHSGRSLHGARAGLVEIGARS